MTTRRTFLWVACLSGLPLFSAMPSAQAVEAGQAMPYFEVTTLDGKVFRPTDAKGQVIVVNLWATWCPTCNEEMPALGAYYQKHKSEGLRVVAVHMGEASEDAKAREMMRPYTYTAGIGRLSKLDGFGRIWRLPMTFVIDRDGILRKDGGEGDPKIDPASLERDVTPLLKAKASPAPKP